MTQSPHDTWPQQGQQPYPPQPPYGPQYPPPYQQQPAPRKKRHLLRKLFLGLAAFIVVIIVIVAVAGSGKSKPGVTGIAAPAHQAAAPAAKAVATFTGSGIKNTPQFTVTTNWKLDYSFSCRSLGQSGNFQVFEDGGKDFSGVTVNDLAMSKTSSTWAYGDGGTHYLEINSECSWTVKVIDES